MDISPEGLSSAWLPPTMLLWDRTHVAHLVSPRALPCHTCLGVLGMRDGAIHDPWSQGCMTLPQLPPA